MRYLKSFNEVNQFDILKSDIENLLPKTLSIYTSNGTYTFDKDITTREVDILRACYKHNTMEDYAGDDAVDGEPDTLELDMHFMKSNVLKIAVDITYGDTMVSEFTIESPNKVTIGHYSGIGSLADPDTHFGFDDVSLQDLCKFFNGFGFKLAPKDFTFIDKHPDSYIREDVKLTPLSPNELIMVVNNDTGENKYLNGLTSLLKMRGIKYVVATTENEVERINSKGNVVGAILTGSEYRVTKPQSKNEGSASIKALEILECPILGICFGFKIMAKESGSNIKSTGKHNLIHKKLTKYSRHPLFDGIDMENIDFSFDFNDRVMHCPDGYKVIGEVGSYITAIANDNSKRYGVLFHPESVERTWKLIDNFTKMFHNSQEEQEKLQKGEFQHFESTVSTRVKQLTDVEFLDILRDKCNNFSFDSDLLWRGKSKKYEFELYEPTPRSTNSVLAFPDFFNKIEGDSDYPVERKKSLIGCTNAKSAKILGDGNHVYLVIPFDNSPIVFCPIVDLWALDDDRGARKQTVNGMPPSSSNFTMVNYSGNFKVPMDKIKRLPKSKTNAGVEFFTSSPCLLIHESKIDWLRTQVK